MNIKNILLILSSGILIGGSIVYKYIKQEPKVNKDSQVVENTKYIERIIKGKDGETIIEKITEVKKETVEKVTQAIPKVRVGLIGGYDFKEQKSTYGLSVMKPLSKELEVGVYIKPNQSEIGLSASWGF